MPTKIIDLPYEVLALIIALINPKQYPSLRLVNTAWNSLLTPYVFKSVTIRNLSFKATFSSILKALERSVVETADGKHTLAIPIGHHIQQLTLLCHDTTGDQLQKIPALCPNITSFTISTHIMDNIAHEELSPQHQHHNRYLKACSNSKPNIRSAFGDINTRRARLAEFFTSLGGPKVKHLKLEGSTSYPLLNEIILPSLLHLVELDIGSVVWKSDHDFAEQPFVEPFVDTINLMDLIQDYCPSLETLSMAKRSLTSTEQNLGIVTSDALASWVSTIRIWSRLKSLHLNIYFSSPVSRCWLVPTLMYLATRLPNLQQLHIAGDGRSRIGDYSKFRKDEQLARLLRTGLKDPSSPKHNPIWPYIFSGVKSIMIKDIVLGFLETMILFGYDELVEGSAITPISIQSMELVGTEVKFSRQNERVPSQHNFLRYCISRNTLTSLLLNCEFTDKCLLDCLATCTNQLETLNIIDSKAVYINSVLDYCPRLRYLGLFMCVVYGSPSNPETVEATILAQPSTTSSTSPSTSTSTPLPASASASASVTVTAIENANQHYHPLKTINFEYAKIKDSSVFGQISRRCPQLSVLHLACTSVYDPEGRKTAKKYQPRNGRNRDKKPDRLYRVIHMPHTKLSLCTFGPGVSFYGPRFEKVFTNILLLPTGHGAATLFHCNRKKTSWYEMTSLGNDSKKILDEMALLGNGDGDSNGIDCSGSDGDFRRGMDECLLDSLKRGGVLTIRCKEIQEMRVDSSTFFGPFVNM